VATRDNGVLDKVLSRLAPLLDAITPLRANGNGGAAMAGVDGNRARA
jgi:hypothetical protein